MAKPKKIPKTTSSPADPNEPSFLTTLPPEVRNAIYEALFKRDDPVLLHNADAYYPKYPERDIYSTDEDHMENIRNYDKRVDENLRRDLEFDHGLGGGLSLLMSCRQVYHESAGVLYGSNTFIITRALHRHDTSNHSSCPDSYNQIHYAPMWLSGLGSQIDLLRQVLVDVGATCPFDCEAAGRIFEIKPLLLLFWSYPGLGSRVKFSKTNRLVGHDFTDVTSIFNDTARGKTELLFNGVLKLVGTQDVLNLKIHRHLNRLPESVTVWEVSDELKVDYPATQSAVYRISNGGTSFRLRTPQPLVHLLPNNVLYRICEFLKCSSLEIFIDLNNRTVRGLDISLLQLARILCVDRSSLVSGVLSCPVIAKASTTTTKMGFDDLSALQSFSDMAVDLFDSVGEFADMVTEQGSSSSLKMELHFDLCSNTALTELEIDIQELSYLLCSVPSFKIQVSLTCSQNGESYPEVLNIDMDRLNLNLFLVLLNIREQRRALLQAGESAALVHININGRGELKSVTYSKSFARTVSTCWNDFADHTKEQMRYLGYRRAKDFFDDTPSYEAFGRDQLGDRLYDLHRKYWGHLYYHSGL